jgi:hypothetical protein
MHGDIDVGVIGGGAGNTVYPTDICKSCNNTEVRLTWSVSSPQSGEPNEGIHIRTGMGDGCPASRRFVMCLSTCDVGARSCELHPGEIKHNCFAMTASPITESGIRLVKSNSWQNSPFNFQEFEMRRREKYRQDRYHICDHDAQHYNTAMKLTWDEEGTVV